MPRATRDNNREAIQKRVRANLEGMEKAERPTATTTAWYDRMDYTGAYTYVSTLASRIANSPKKYAKYVEDKSPALITDIEWITPLSMGIHNLPKLADMDTYRLNFAFGKDYTSSKKNYEEMVSTPKVAICVYTRKLKLNNRDFNKVQVYCIAPNMRYSELPVIYRIDVLSIPHSTKFFGVRCVAMVGGCIDGECPLFQLNTDSHDGSRLYRYKSKYTCHSVDPRDEVSNACYDVKAIESVHNISAACDYAFKLFNVQGKMINRPTGLPNMMDILDCIDSNKGIQSIDSGYKFIDAFLSRPISSIVGKERQMIYTEDGGIKQSSFRHKTKTETLPAL